MALRYTADHAASSYGQPVLVDTETGAAYGPGDLLTATQAGALLGIGERHVRHLAKTHGVGATVNGRLVGIAVADAEGLRAHLRPGMGRPKKGGARGDG